MFHKGQELYLHLGDSETRELHPIRVESVEDTAAFVTLTSDFERADPPDPDLETVAFFQGPKEFMQQPVRVVEAPPEEGAAPRFGIVTTGEAVSAESRECFRVSTVLGGHTVRFAQEGERQLADVSATGLAVIGNGAFAFGDVVEITFTAGGRTFTGSCCVQSIKQVRRGFRYGLLALSGSPDFVEGLQKLTMDAQRTQLRRLAGAA